MKTTQALIYSLIIFTVVSLSSCDSGGDDPKPTGNNNPPAMGGGGSGGGSNGGGSNGGGSGGGSTATVAPGFTLQNLSDQEVKLSDYKGKVVLLFFFGNTCPSCRAVAPSVQSQLVTPYASNENFVALGIDQWDGTKASVQGFKNTTGVDFDLLLKGSSVAGEYSTTYDRLIVVDKEGNIRFKGTRGASSDISSAKSTIAEYIDK